MFGIFDFLYISSLYFDVITLGNWQLKGGYHSLNEHTFTQTEKYANTLFYSNLYLNITNVFFNNPIWSYIS